MADPAVLEKPACLRSDDHDGTPRPFERNDGFVLLDDENDRPTQMNVRIGKSLKQRGDEVLASRGLNPSQGIRAFYRLLANCDENPELVDAVLNPSDEDSDRDAAAERTRKMESFHECCKSIESLCNELGIKPWDALSDDPNERAQQYKQMREDAAWDKYYRTVKS